MIIDGHVHIGLSAGESFPEFAAPEVVIHNMDRNGIDKISAIIMLREDEFNQASLDEIAPYRERFLPFMMIDPRWQNAVEKLKFCFDQLGAVGLKLHPLANGYRVDEPGLLDPLLDLCCERGAHVIIHCTSGDDCADPEKLETIAKRFSRATFQLAHMGAIYDGSRAIAAAGRTENLYVDTGIASFNAVRRAVLAIPEKVIMGSDYPFYMFEMEKLKIECACRWAGKPERFADIAGGNLARILGL